MFFFALALFLLSSWFFPWWTAALIGLGFGILTKPRPWLAEQVGAAAGFSWLVWAFTQDGLNFGLISRRLAGLFHLPAPFSVIAVTAAFGFITACLATHAGRTVVDLKGELKSSRIHKKV